MLVTKSVTSTILEYIQGPVWWQSVRLEARRGKETIGRPSLSCRDFAPRSERLVGPAALRIVSNL